MIQHAWDITPQQAVQLQRDLAGCVVAQPLRGPVRTVAGTAPGFAGDGGPATLARLSTPGAITGDAAGNLYIADTGNSKIRLITSTGIISTIAGSGNGIEEFAYAGDGGPATQAKLNYPSDVLLDGKDGLLIADFANHRIRRVTLSTGIITTFAGNGSGLYSGDGGPAGRAGIPYPRGLGRDLQGNIYVASDNMVRRIDAASGVITAVAGTNIEGFSGDGSLALLARLTRPQAVLLDAAGNLIVSDTDNDRIRRVSGQALMPALAIEPSTLSFVAVEGAVSQVGQMVQITSSNLANTLWMATARVDNGTGWLGLRPNVGVTPGILQVLIDPAGLPAGNYTGNITITGARVTNAPQVLTVALKVKPAGPPQLAAEPETVTLRTIEGGGATSSQTIELTNSGGGILAWSASARTERRWRPMACSAAASPTRGCMGPFRGFSGSTSAKQSS